MQIMQAVIFKFSIAFYCQCTGNYTVKLRGPNVEVAMQSDGFGQCYGVIIQLQHIFTSVNIISKGKFIVGGWL